MLNIFISVLFCFPFLFSFSWGIESVASAKFAMKLFYILWCSIWQILTLVSHHTISSNQAFQILWIFFHFSGYLKTCHTFWSFYRWEMSASRKDYPHLDVLFLTTKFPKVDIWLSSSVLNILQGGESTLENCQVLQVRFSLWYNISVCACCGVLWNILAASSYTHGFLLLYDLFSVNLSFNS